jgi:uncharacterized coiled-coil protein SlyX
LTPALFSIFLIIYYKNIEWIYVNSWWFPEFNQRLPEFNQRLPEFNQRLPEFNQLLPEFNQRLSEFNQLLPEFSKRLSEFSKRLSEFNGQRLTGESIRAFVDKLSQQAGITKKMSTRRVWGCMVRVAGLVDGVGQGV